MAAEINSNPLLALIGAMESVLELSGAGRVVEACNRLSTVLEQVSAAVPEELPSGCRPDLHRLLAVLTLPSWDEAVRWAAALSIDLRDLVEAEIAYAERVTVKTTQRWRVDGHGPPYRNEAGIRYPVSWYWEWRRKGRQNSTAQKITRGPRR